MKREIPFFPPLLAIFPVLSIFSTNLSLVPAAQLWRPMGLAVGYSILVWLVCALIWRNLVRGAAMASVIVLSTFMFGWLVEGQHMEDRAMFAFQIWGAITAMVAILAGWKIRKAKFLNVLSVMLTVVTLVRAAQGYYQITSIVRKAEVRDATSKKGPRPDIFYIITDGYGRTDALEKTLGYSNRAFISSLKRRGFFVADESHSNYCQTEISLASSLNFDTVQSLLPNINLDEMDRSPLGALIRDSEAMRVARQEGYVVVGISSGFPPVQQDHADLRLEGEEGMTLVESALYLMTPLRLQEAGTESQFTMRRRKLAHAFWSLEWLAETTLRPRFVFAHLLAPHPPFVFTADGTPVRHKGPFGYWDGSDYMEYAGTPESYREGYSQQAEYLNKRLLGIVDRLLATKGPKPIIIIQGDHGSKLKLSQNSLQKTDVTEVFPILNAYYVPKDVRANLYPSITPVNTFRVIFSTLFGRDLPRLPDNSYYSEYAKPYRFTDVTEQVVAAKPKKKS